MFCLRNVSFSNRKLQHEPQPTWTTPYGLCINWCQTQQDSSRPRRHTTGCELRCRNARRSKLARAHICTDDEARPRVWEPCCVVCSPSSRCVARYYETISEVLSSVRKMEESLKRLKQARKGATAATTVAGNGAPTDDGKIRLQLALDVEYLGEQVRLCLSLELDTGMCFYCIFS